MIRRAAVAGRFYPGRREALESELRTFVPDERRHLRARALIVPHAGYAYSGKVAAATYASIERPRRYFLLCPNHVGLGAPISIVSHGEWETPLGLVRVDGELANLLKSKSLIVQECPDAHRGEHALEVQIPFLQYFLGQDFSFVPISVGTRRYETLRELGEALAACLREVDEEVVMVASSDMNHFETAERTEAKDRLAIEAILELDTPRLREVVERYDISMCGYGPAVAVIEAARRLGASRAELIQYTHSGRITGDDSSVVGYAGMVIC